ncbi:MAG: NAD-dependent epimerase/dehydratase family protein [Deltaproteobacteria bacterium]|jgi:nucleoside-diphosphate-sugar epimerase|nr:NAD-dependent epimerase/dehydratase family protein [Deltaproteobacteria bacterium]MCW8891892.1 NAD-dependent epimerase/dehydratase family protein [Deltaproteobacteria bacterium]MCW9049789.1 NAD-dependent epimerase/dehydratase family protein [Deltaproteobacteria bacterium]
MKILVTGGGGFLGKAIIKLLLQQGHQLRSYSRSTYPQLKELGVEQLSGDLNDPESVSQAVKGCELVFHVAAKAGVWGRSADYYQTNVLGTKNIIHSCRKYRVQRLIYTSSPSVVFDGTDMEGVNESVPYPEHFHADYPQTKAQAERLVLSANDQSLATVALRPHLIWGPEDNHLVPRIWERGRAGALRKIGRRDCLVDTVYIDNAAKAHIQAAEQLAVNPDVAGKAYFIANDEPLPLWDMVNQILATADIPPVTGMVSPRSAYAAGWLLEKIYRTFNLSGEPRMTRFVAKELSTAHWFDLSAAKKDLGYQPAVSIEEGLERLRNWRIEGSSGY